MPFKDSSGQYVQPVVLVNESGSYRPSFHSSTAYQSASVISVSQSVLYSVHGYSVAAQYIQIIDATSSVASQTPDIIIKVAADSNFLYSAGDRGVVFDNGIVVNNSSVPSSSSFGSKDCWFSVVYK